MFTPGEFVYCINDRFHPSIAEWGDQFPKLDHIYTVRAVKLCADGVTGQIGYGLLLHELHNPQDRLHFSAWRFRRVWEDVEIEQVEQDQATASSEFQLQAEG